MAKKPEPTTPTEEVIDMPAPVVVIVRRLRVNRQYAGYQSQEQAIIPGTYYEDDPALCGLAGWLVTQHYAEWIG